MEIDLLSSNACRFVDIVDVFDKIDYTHYKMLTVTKRNILCKYLHCSFCAHSMSPQFKLGFCAETYRVIEFAVSQNANVF